MAKPRVFASHSLFDAARKILNDGCEVEYWAKPERPPPGKKSELSPLAFVEAEADDDGNLRSIACRDDEWALGYEMPPLKIMQIRLSGLARSEQSISKK